MSMVHATYSSYKVVHELGENVAIIALLFFLKKKNRQREYN